MVAWALVASLITATSAVAHGGDPRLGADTGFTALARASAATVTLEVQSACCGASGSGLLLTHTGLIATSAQVLAGAQRVRVRLSTGEVFDAQGMLSYEPRLDLALILIPGAGLPSAPLADSDSLVVGQRLRAIGVPYGLGTTVTDGLLREVRTEGGVPWLHLSAPAAPGSSGGPVVDEQGEVVGLVVVGPPGSVWGGRLDMAIPINGVRGEVGRLAGKTAIPFGEMEYADAAPTPSGEPWLDKSPIDVGADLDFRPLNGVVLYFEERYAGPHSVRDSTGYGVFLMPDGRLGLERRNTRDWRDQSASLAEQALRTTYIFGESNRSVSAGTTSPRAGGIPADAWELRIEGGRYWYNAAGRVREGEASPGVVPREMLSAILAALPDSLPAEVHVSVLDAAADTSRDVTVRFGRRESRSIPVPRVGRTCGANVPTRSAAVDVVQATRQTETDMVSVVVLARRPHVILGGAAAGMTSSLKCVVIPGVVP